MRKNMNTERIEGRVYQHSLSVKQVQNQSSANFGKDFISGELDIAVDDDCLNVITVHYTYVTETTKNGNKNSTYAALKQIIDSNQSITEVGMESALKVRVDTSLALNDFYNQNDELVSAKRNEGGFVTIISALDKNEANRNKFTVDMLITNIKHVEADEERDIQDHVVVHGAIFDFKNAILPVDFIVESEAGKKYFDSLEVNDSEPIYTKVWGQIVCRTIVRLVEEESAFGEPSVTSYERKSKLWIITGTMSEPYAFGEENVMTVEEVNKAIQDRQVYLADVKKRAEDYKASREVKTTAPATNAAAPKAGATAKKGNFKF